MPKFLVSEEGRRPKTVKAKYESAAATNYVADVRPGKLSTVRRVTVRAEFRHSVGAPVAFAVVDLGFVCMAYMGSDLVDEEILAKAEQEASESRPRLIELGEKLDIEGAAGLETPVLLREITKRMPRGGESVTVDRD